MMRRRSIGRAIAVLAIGGVLAGSFAMSPSFGAISKKKVKKIATRVFNKNIGRATAGFLGNDLTRVQVDSANDTDDFKSLTANCPAGKYAVSGGGWTSAFPGDAFAGLTMSSPSGQNPQATAPPTGWTVSGEDFNPGSIDSWSLHVVAICATP